MAGYATCCLRQWIGLRLQFSTVFSEVIKPPAIIKAAGVFDRHLEGDGILFIPTLQTGFAPGLCRKHFHNHHRAFRKLSGVRVLTVSRGINVDVVIDIGRRRMAISPSERTSDENPLAVTRWAEQCVVADEYGGSKVSLK